MTEQELFRRGCRRLEHAGNRQTGLQLCKAVQ